MFLHLLLYVGKMDDTEIPLRPADAIGMESLDSTGYSKHYSNRSSNAAGSINQD